MPSLRHLQLEFDLAKNVDDCSELREFAQSISNLKKLKCLCLSFGKHIIDSDLAKELLTSISFLPELTVFTLNKIAASKKFALYFTS